MNISLHSITVRELTDGYTDSQEHGVTGYSGRLNIRPAFQREFIYNEKQQREVINSIIHGYPLNVMYWVRAGENSYEMLDGQQRTLSICKYVNGDYFLNDKNFSSQPRDTQQKILDYTLMIYICEGDSSEILDWFEVINIAGERLTKQESRNASLPGRWLSDAKRHFSRRGCEAQKIAEAYMAGSPIRQEYLEAVIRWKAEHDNIPYEKDIVRAYMSLHRNDENCNDMWLYFLGVMNWVKLLFPKPAKAMKTIDWGKYYNRFHGRHYDTGKIQARIRELLDDEEVTSEKGIYEYVIDGEEKHLSLRKFGDKVKRAVYERQGHKCAECGKEFAIEEMEADHITPWSDGGRTIEENCQLLCRKCNREKGKK